MNVDINFEKLKHTILLAAKNQGLSEDYISKNWHIDYKINQNEEFKEIVSSLYENIKLINQAIEHKDMLTAIVAIVRSKVYSHTLMNFFENINDDIVQLGWGEELKDKWPAIPEDYKVPEHYDYEDTNKPYSQQISDESSL